MKRLTTAACICAAAVMSFAAPAAADSDKPNNVAAKLCAAEKHADKAAFEATYGPKHAMRNCKRAHRGDGETTTPAEAGEEFANAAQECRAERQADPDAFETTYGTNRNGRNAFGKCVSQRVHEDEADPPTA